MRFHNLHLPAEVRIFTVPAVSIRRWDAGALVYDVQVGPGQFLRHYSFPDRWFAVNCSLDQAGGFVTEPGAIAWTFNCDICTPYVAEGDSCYDVDLELDVLVGPDGREHVVIDEEDFAAACAHGWLTPAEVAGARAGLAELLELIRAGRFLAFLQEICPFGSMAGCGEQPPLQRVRLAEVPRLYPRG